MFLDFVPPYITSTRQFPYQVTMIITLPFAFPDFKLCAINIFSCPFACGHEPAILSCFHPREVLLLRVECLIEVTIKRYG